MALIGLGIDLVEVEEAERLLTRWGNRLLDRLLTEHEKVHVLRSTRSAEPLAVRLAAKEAVYKALQALPDARAVRWRDIEVVRRQDGRPSVRLHGEAARLTQVAGLVRISLSLSHTRRTAGAVAVIEQD